MTMKLPDAESGFDHTNKKKYEMSNFFSCLFTGLNPHATYKSFQQNTLPASHKKSSLPFPPDMQTDSTLSGF